MSESRRALEQQFDRILGERGPAIARLAYSYEAVASVREELVQEIALAIWQALGRFRGECSERTFVFRIAHNRHLCFGARVRRISRMGSEGNVASGDTVDSSLRRTLAQKSAGSDPAAPDIHLCVSGWVISCVALTAANWTTIRPDAEAHPRDWLDLLVASVLMQPVLWFGAAWLRRRKLAELKEVKTILDEIKD